MYLASNLGTHKILW